MAEIIRGSSTSMCILICSSVKGIGWDDLVLDAVCAHYGLDKAVMALPKKEKPAEKAPEKKQGKEK